MIKKIVNFFTKHQGIAGATFLIGFSGILSKLVGILNNSLIASKFGTSRELDIFLAIQSVIDLAVAIFTITLSVVFIPVFVELIYSKDKKYQAKELTDNLFTFLLLSTSFLVFLLFLFANPLIRVFFGFNNMVDSLAQNLFRISSFTIIPLTLGSLAVNILSSKKQFLLPSLVALILSVMPSISILFFGSFLNIYALSLAAILGSWGTLLLLLGFLYADGYKFDLKLNFEDKNFKNVLISSFWLSLSASAVQLNGLTDKIFAARLPVGSISSLNYARIIREIPLTITTALTLAILPFFSEKVLLKKSKELSALLLKSLKVGSYILIPAVVGIFVLSDQIITVLFERGVFNQISRHTTVSILAFLLPGLIFYWFISIFTRVFYAKKAYKTVIIIGLFAILFNIFADWFLVKFFSIRGIALATSLMEILFFLVYAFLTKKLVISFNIGEFVRSAIRILGVSLAMGFSLHYVVQVMGWNNQVNLVFNTIRLAISIILGVAIYVFLSIFFKINELVFLFEKIRKLVFKK